MIGLYYDGELVQEMGCGRPVKNHGNDFTPVLLSNITMKIIQTSTFVS